MTDVKFVITFDAKKAIKSFKSIGEDGLKDMFNKGLEFVSKVLLRDCRKYIPILTGALRDSGHIEKISNTKSFAKILIWDVASKDNGYIYAKKQYTEVLQHINGIYAAEWLEKAVNENPYKYTRILTLFIRREYNRLLEKE